MEISVPITLDNVTNDTRFVELSTWSSGRTYKYTVESGYYDSLVQLMSWVPNDTIWPGPTPI